MANLLIRNATNKVLLTGTTTGSYILAKYEMGSPIPNDGSVVREGSMQNGICVDTLTVNVVGKTKDGTSLLVSKLYRSLSDASNYWKGGYPYPVYLEAQVTGYTTSLYATIVDFQFHALPDSFDEVNGKIVQNATIVLTRSVWSELPPQDLFYAFRDGSYVKKTYPFSYWFNNYSSVPGTPWNPELLYKLETTQRLPRASATSVFRTITGRADDFDHTLFLSSADRGAVLSVIAFQGIAPLDPNASGYVGPPTLWRDDVEGMGHSLYLRFTGRGHGIVYEIAYPEGGEGPTLLGAVDVYYHTGEQTWTEINKIDVPTRESAVEDSGYLTYPQRQNIHTWNSNNPLLMSVWLRDDGSGGGTTTGLGMDSYWMKLQAKSNDDGFSLDLNNDILSGENWPYMPTRPWLDVEGHSGSLPMPIRMVIKSFNHGWADLYDDFLRSKVYMNRLIVATGYGDTHTATNSWDVAPPDTMPMGFYNYTDDPFSVFPEYRCESLAPSSYAFVNDSSSPSTRAIACQISSTYLNTGSFRKIAQHTIPWGGGLFRAFIRLSCVGPSDDSESFAHFRLSVKRMSSTAWDTRETAAMSAVATLDAASEYTGSSTQSSIFNYINMVDLGVIRLGASRTSPDEEVLYYITTEVAVSGDFSPNLRLHDLILLPVNDNFMFVSGDYLPLYTKTDPGDFVPPQTDYSLPTIQPYRNNQRGLYIDGLAPHGIRAGIASTAIPQNPILFEQTPANSLLWEDRFLAEWSVNSSGTFSVRPGTKNRFFFLFYKVAPDGTLLSSYDMVFSATPFGAKNYVTLPGVY